MEPGSAQANTKGKPHKRKRGAQPGNTNALKHGLYARYMAQLEHENFIDSSVLDSELTMLRTSIQCLFDQTGAADAKTLTASLTALARASAALARLIQANQQAQDRDNPVQDSPVLVSTVLDSTVLDTINQGVSQIYQDLTSQKRSSTRSR